VAIRIGDGILDLDRGTFHRAGELVPLRPKTIDLLAHFVRNPERLITKDELLDTVWPHTTVTEDSLTQCVRDLRKALGDGRQEIVRTIARRGYLFQPPKDTVADPVAEPPGAGSPAVSGRAAEPVVAVLPFRPASGGLENASMLDGVVEELINALACFRTVAVFARHSAFELAKSRPDELLALVSRFGIDYLVEGVVAENEGGLRITVTLSEAATNRRVWMHPFSLAEDGALAAPATIARQIITALASNIESAAMRRAAGAPATSSAAAYGHLLRGISLLRSYGPDVNEQARDCFLEAIRLDPASGLARAYLALAEAIIGGYCTAGPGVLDRARDIALEAVALAPDEARCHRILGLILLYCRDFDASERHYARALEINPYDADTLMQKGHMLAMRGAPEAGLALADRAVGLNPLHPVWYHFDRAEILFAGERYGEAVAALSCLPRKDAWHFARLAAACAMIGDRERAARCVEEGRRLEPTLTIGEILRDVASELPDNRERMQRGLLLAGWPET
jgi:DNA-binding winged helix-turn-helix (wHTH) protein/tetratricopeptide (TPR) repeat protein